MVINPDNGIIYQLNVNAVYYGQGQCYSYQNTFNYDFMDKEKFEELLDLENEELNTFFDDMSHFMIYIILIVIAVVLAVYLGWQGFLFGCMMLEGMVATLIVWLLVFVMGCFGVFKEFGDIRPGFGEIWRINLLLCVPDFTFVRLLQMTSIAFYWRILARVILTCLLIIDVYQNEPPHDKQS